MSSNNSNGEGAGEQSGAPGEETFPGGAAAEADDSSAPEGEDPSSTPPADSAGTETTPAAPAEGSKEAGAGETAEGAGAVGDTNEGPAASDNSAALLGTDEALLYATTYATFNVRANYLDQVLSIAGPYRFNATGNTNCSGKWGSGRTELYSSSFPYNAVDPVYAGLSRNSSTAALMKTTGKSRVHRAFLVVAATQNKGLKLGGVKGYPLGTQGCTFVGPKGTRLHLTPTTIFTDSEGVRASCYFDVTDFVKQQGYGNYSCLNIPYTAMAGDTAKSSDYFGAWKLIVVEEDVDLPIRLVRLKLGGDGVSRGNASEVSIDGEGLSVGSIGSTAAPSGDVLFSMDGTDMGDSKQRFIYSTTGGAGMSGRSLYDDALWHAADRFFTQQIHVRNVRPSLDPAPQTAYKSNHSDYLYLNEINDNNRFTQSNTDLGIMAVNDPANPGTLALQGGETRVSVTLDTSSQPTLLSALGLAVDVKVPIFETKLTVENLGRPADGLTSPRFTTADKGYDTTYQYAIPGDRLRAKATCKNVSGGSSQIGIRNSEITLEAPAFASIDESTIDAWYVEPDGTRIKLTDIKVAGSTITAKPDAGKNVSSGGKFELSFEGVSKSSSTLALYDNKVYAKGTFVDEAGGDHVGTVLSSLGSALAVTSSDSERFRLEVVNVAGDGTATSKGSNGLEIEGTMYYPCDDTPTALGVPSEGWHAKVAVVDGKVRDDALVADGSASVDVPMESRDHKVQVAFARGDRPQREFYPVDVTGDGGTDSLTPGTLVPAGGSHTVSWSVKPGYELVSVTVDGAEIPLSAVAAGSLTFDKVATDHHVVVRTAPTGGKPAAGLVLRTQIVGGEGTITPGAADIAAGEDRTVAWTVGVGWKVKSIAVDGKELGGSDFLNASAAASLAFSNMRADHSVVVTLQKNDAPEPDVGPYRVDVTWEGDGTAGQTGLVTAGGTHRVSWDAAAGSYVRMVRVDGVDRPDLIASTTQGEMAFTQIRDNHTVHVVFARQPKAEKQFKITLEVYSGGTRVYNIPIVTSGFGTIGQGASRDVSVKIGAGTPDYPANLSTIQTVKVDGVEQPATDTEFSYRFENVQQDHIVRIYLKRRANVTGLCYVNVTSEGPGTAGDSGTFVRGESFTAWAAPHPGARVKQILVNKKDITKFYNNPDATANYASWDGSELTLERWKALYNSGSTVEVKIIFEEDADTRYRIDARIVGGPGEITGSGDVAVNGNRTVTWKPDADYEVRSVTVDGTERPDLLDADRVAFARVQGNHEVVVELARAVKIPSDPDGLRPRISVSWEGPGIAGTSALVDAGTDHTVTWQAAANAHVEAVFVDGIEMPGLLGAGQTDFLNVQSDHMVHVVFATDDPAPPTTETFNVAASIVGGPGTISGSGPADKGSNRTVEWAPGAGFRVKSVVIDGVERDDLLEAPNFTFTSIAADHEVTVYLEDDSTPRPTDGPFKVTVEWVGCGTAGDTAVVAKDANHRVTWRPDPNASVVKVLVDGRERPDLLNAGAYSFTHIARDHHVRVMFSPNEGGYRITTLIEEGQGAVSGSGNVQAGGSATATWAPAAGWVLKRVVVDGVTRDDLLEAGKLDFTNIRSNHVVCVAFAREGEIEEPKDDLYPIDVTWEGDGTAGESALVEKGSTHQVTWAPAAGAVVEKVLIDGVERTEFVGGAALSTEFVAVAARHSVHVVFSRASAEPQYQVTATIKGGPGTITGSGPAEAGSSRTVTWAPQSGYTVSKVLVDGAVRDDLLDQTSVTFSAIAADHDVVVVLGEDEREEAPWYPIDVTWEGDGEAGQSAQVAAGANHSVSWTPAAGASVERVLVDGMEQPQLAGAAADRLMEFVAVAAPHRVHVVFTKLSEGPRYTIEASLVGGPGTVTGSGPAPAGSQREVTWDAEPGWRVASVVVDGAVRDDLLPALGTTGGATTFENISANHRVTVVLEKDDGPLPDPGEDPFRIDVTWEGSGVAGESALVLPGATHPVTWAPLGGATVEEVLVDGVSRPDLLGAYATQFAAVARNHSVHVVFSKAADEPIDQKRYHITAAIEGGPGTTAGSGFVAAGASHTVNWAPGEGWVVKSVLVDGKVRDDLLDEDCLVFENVSADHAVIVVLGKDEAFDEELIPIDVTWEGDGTAGQSALVSRGDSHQVRWEPAVGATVQHVYVDDRERPDLCGVAADRLAEFVAVSVPHKVHVVFSRESAGDQFMVTARIVGGPGDVSGSGPAQAGTDRTVEWAPEAGWHVKTVLVDGVTRDDLALASSTAFENIDQDHEVTVILEKGPAPVPDDGPCYVRVSYEGPGVAGQTARVMPGDDHTVAWEPADGARVVSVVVDGVERPDLVGSLTTAFADIQRDHTVHVVFASPDDDPDAKTYRIDVDIVGGPGEASGSGPALAGSSRLTEWEAAEGWRIQSVVVDGVARDDLLPPAGLRSGSLLFEAIAADHQVLVVLDEDDGLTPDEPGDLLRIDVTWEGNGTAGDSALVPPGSSHGVTWKPGPGATVEEVLVDGVSRPDLLGASSTSFAQIARNHKVHVVFSDDRDADDERYQIDVRVEGGPGTASGSGPAVLGDSREVHWAPAPGWHVSRVVVDGVERPDLVRAGKLLFENIDGSHSVVIELEEGELEPEPDDPVPDGPDPGPAPDLPKPTPDTGGDPTGAKPSGGNGGKGHTTLLWTRLAQTGDETSCLAFALGVLAAGALVLARKRMRRSRER